MLPCIQVQSQAERRPNKPTLEPEVHGEDHKSSLTCSKMYVCFGTFRSVPSLFTSPSLPPHLTLLSSCFFSSVISAFSRQTTPLPSPTFSLCLFPPFIFYTNSCPSPPPLSSFFFFPNLISSSLPLSLFPQQTVPWADTGRQETLPKVLE